jgi:hypothetical protein
MARKAKVQQFVESVESPEKNKEVIAAFGNRLKNRYDLWKKMRRAKELEWIENLRQHKGVYDPDVKIDANGSKVYPKVTRSKDNLVLSKLHEMLFPGTDRNWSIEPTPVPSVDKKIASQLALALVQPDQQGNLIAPTTADLKKAIVEYTKKTADDMQAEMDDQFIEMKYTVKVGKPVLRSGILFGTGVAKGPLVNKYQRVEWELKGKEVEERTVEEREPYYRFVPIWNWYPDMTVTEQEDMDGSFERHVYSKHQVRELAKLAGFNADFISDYLKEHPNGDYKPEPWEQDVRQLERDTEESGTRRTDSGDYINMGEGGFEGSTGVKYEVAEYWGYVDSQDLFACGETIPEKETHTEIHANVWLLGGMPVKAVINPMPKERDPYKLFYYEKDETSIWGEGLPRSIRHSQLAIGAAARMALNNAAICSGPQFEMNWDLMETDMTDLNDIHPMKIWVRRGMGAESQYPAMRVYNVESHIQDYMLIIDRFMTFGDIEATLPTWMISEPIKSGNETVGATSMKMGTINISLRDLVRNFDDFTEDVVEALYLWNMDFNPKREIKGDFKVKAKGSTSLIMKEVRINALNMFATTMAPEDWAYVPRRQFLEERVKANELDITLRTEEEAQAYIQSLKDIEMAQLAKDAMRADITKKKAMALSLASKAKKTNIEAVAPTPKEASGQTTK